MLKISVQNNIFFWNRGASWYGNNLLLFYALQIKASFYGEVKERWILVARACVYRLGGAHTTHTNDAPNT